MMRKFYRNRHTTFIKALLDQKKAKEEAEQEQRAKLEKRKQKLKEKVLANIQPNDSKVESSTAEDDLGSTINSRV
jgi:ribosomal protein L9